MRVSLNWLKDYVEIDVPISKLLDDLTNIGLNVEETSEFEDDLIIDLEITSNRSDCLSHIGIAREIACLLDKRLNTPEHRFKEAEIDVSELTTVEVKEPNLCPRYTARLIRNVNIGPSPEWLVRRLEAVGLRSINNVVDITNYVLMEYGQPLHAFDFDKVEGHRIIVRCAEEGEKLTTIDHTEHKLSSQDLIIADANRPIALAGIMGGLDTEVTESTINVLLESAEFDPICIRRTARRLSLQTESSYRFERKVDPVGVELASRRATYLIQEIAGGEVAKGLIDVWNKKWKPNIIEFDTRLVKRILGIEVGVKTCEKILTQLGFETNNTKAGKFTVTVPPFRRDVYRPIDLVEEIGRVVGFDKVPSAEKISIVAQPISKEERINRVAHNVLNHCGYSEAITLTLVPPEYAHMFVDFSKEEPLKISANHRMLNNTLRTSLIPSLLQVRKLNQDVGNLESNLYEIARVFLPAKGDDNLPIEEIHLAILDQSFDLRPIKGAFELILRTLHIDKVLEFIPIPCEWFEKGKSADILLDGEKIGIVGVISNDIAKRFDLKKQVAVAEINFDKILSLPITPPRFVPLPKFPAIRRDFSILVDQHITWKMIEDAVKSLKLSEMEKVSFGEVFKGKQIPKGKKSIFFSVIFRRADRSLTHEEVDEYQERIVSILRQRYLAELRV